MTDRKYLPAGRNWVQLGLMACQLIAMIFSCKVYSQSLYVDRIGLSDGLSQNTITSIAQDRKGFMWFGTQDGLNRYDGYSFKRYSSNPNDPHSMSGKIVWALLVDQAGVLWVGTLYGLNSFDAETERFVSYVHDPKNSQSISDNAINSIYEDSKGRLWVATASGLNKFDKQQQTFKRYLHMPDDESSISNSGINAIFEDSHGVLWIGTDQGINRFDEKNQRFTVVNDKTDVLKTAIIFTIEEDSLGRLWIGTGNQGLFAYNKQRNVIKRYSHNPNKLDSISTDKIKTIYKDSKQRIWIGTDGGGLSRLDEKKDKFINYRNNPSDIHSISDDAIYSIFEDSTGVLWVGSYTNGLSKLNPYSFSLTLVSNKPTYEDQDPLKDSRAFVVSGRGETWVGSSYNGIKVTQADGKKRHYKHDPNNPNSLSGDKVYSLLESHDGTIWVGAASGWLNEYDRKSDTFIRYHVQPTEKGSLRHDEIRAMIIDQNGVLWLGTDPGGIHSFDRSSKQFTHYHHDPNDPQSISRNEVFGLYEDSKGLIWVATFGGGLNKFDPSSGKFTVFRHSNMENSISNDFPLSVYEDINDEALWVGIYGAGLDRLDLNTYQFKNFGIADGLSDDSIYGVLQDKSGALWVSHNKGLSRFDPKTLIFDNYDERDGLQSNEFNGGAYYRAPDGKLFFGGVNGYNGFYPDEIQSNPHKPPVYITNFELFNKPVAINEQYDGRVLLPQTIVDLDKITLSYKDYVFSLEFAALDYAYSSKNQYAYRMEGLEQQWNYVSDRRFVTYTTLPAGDYVFRVKASNNNGVWNEEGVALAISITPPFWQTWWFRIICVMAVLLIVFVVYTLRVKAIQERNKTLKVQVKERTADLEKTLYELGETKDALIEAAHKAGMADTATGVLHNVGNLLNSVNTSAGIIREVVDNSVTKKFLRADELLISNKDNLMDFITNDTKGEKLLKYFIDLSEPFEKENETLRENAVRLKEKISAIKETITAQQSFAQGEGFIEEVSLKDMIEDSILLQSGSIGRHEITIERKYDDQVPNVKVQKAKLMQILINLYKNAKESMDACKVTKNVLTIEINQDDKYAYIRMSDTGLGIAKEQLTQIFSHGFTTKEDGHGFGLHSCANYMTEMGGKMWAESEGVGCGATFVMSFPLGYAVRSSNDEDISDETKVA